MFIPPPPHYRGTPSDFTPSINDCWYGRVNLIFKMRVRTDAGRVMECQCALIETLYNFRPTKSKSWWPSTAQVGTKLLYLPSPEPVVYVVPLSHILGKLPLVPAGDHQRTGLCTPRALHVHTVHTVHSVHSVRTPAERLPSTKTAFLSVSLVNSLVLAAYIART